jgi:hypothetical protein
MRGVWDSDDIQRAAVRLLWFSASESETIRTTLTTCCFPRPIDESSIR